MNKAIWFAFILIHFSIDLWGQPKSDLRRDYIWTFANNSSYHLPENDAFKFVFNDADSLVIEETSFPYEIWFANATICDENGDLLFQSNGCSVLDANNHVIQGGEFLNEGNFINNHCPNGILTSDGIVSLPFSDSVYFLLYPKVENFLAGLFYNDLRFSKIIKNESKKLVVIEKDQPILTSKNIVGGNFGLVRHSNGKDWWIIVSQVNSSNKIKILLGENGVIEIKEQEIGSILIENDSGAGSAVFSPDGKKLAIYNTYTDLHLFDFNRCTGELSNSKNILIKDVADIVQSAGAAFAPNSRFLYLSSTLHIYQYDMWANNIESSKVVVGTYDGFRNSSGFTTRFHKAKLGADGKIYIGSPSNRGVFHIIHRPNEKGADCRFEQHAIYLPVHLASGTMSHHPNFRLGPEKGTTCDSLNIPSWLTIEAHPYNQIVCSGDKTHFEVTAFGYLLSYQWQINEGNGWKDLQNNNQLSGVRENYLSLNETDTTMEGWQFRCIVQADTEIDTSRVGVLDISSQKPTVADYELTINEDTIWIENKSQNGEYFEWLYGDYQELDSMENPPYHVYEWQEDYDSVYRFELLVQNECSHDWKRDSISINIPKFELDFEIIESGICEDEPYVIFEDVSNERHRILTRKWWSTRSKTPQDTFSTKSNLNPVTFKYWDNTDVYNQSLVACDKIRCDTLKKEEMVRIYETPFPRLGATHQNGRVYSLNCRCDLNADSINWYYEDKTFIATGNKVFYEFEKDSTYKIIVEAINPCTAVYDSLEVEVEYVLGIIEDNELGKINVNPNPASSHLTIEFEEFTSGNIQFRLNDLTGRKLETFNLSNSPSQQISLSDYLSGVYFYQILVDGLPWKTDRLLIVR